MKAEMQTGMLLERFAGLIQTAQDVKKLEQAILQWAVQGRLVAQDPSDEPANVLLERIAAEKARLIEEGVIRKGKKLGEISAEERTTSLPSGWDNIRFSELGMITGGKTPSKRRSEYWDGNVLWVTPKDMKSRFINNSQLKITEFALADSSIAIIPKGSVLIVA